MCTNMKPCAINMVRGVGKPGTAEYDTIQPDIHCFHFWHCQRPNNLKISHNKISTIAE